MNVLSRIKTKDILAVMVVGAALVFNGISMTTGRPLDPTTIGFTGIIIGHYFKGAASDPSPRDEGPLPLPATGDGD